MGQQQAGNLLGQVDFEADGASGQGTLTAACMLQAAADRKRWRLYPALAGVCVCVGAARARAVNDPGVW